MMELISALGTWLWMPIPALMVWHYHRMQVMQQRVTSLEAAVVRELPAAPVDEALDVKFEMLETLTRGLEGEKKHRESLQKALSAKRQPQPDDLSLQIGQGSKYLKTRMYRLNEAEFKLLESTVNGVSTERKGTR